MLRFRSTLLSAYFSNKNPFRVQICHLISLWQWSWDQSDQCGVHSTEWLPLVHLVIISRPSAHACSPWHDTRTLWCWTPHQFCGSLNNWMPIVRVRCCARQHWSHMDEHGRLGYPPHSVIVLGHGHFAHRLYCSVFNRYNLAILKNLVDLDNFLIAFCLGLKIQISDWNWKSPQVIWSMNDMSNKYQPSGSHYIIWVIYIATFLFSRCLIDKSPSSPP